jgi:hypothetical protein
VGLARTVKDPRRFKEHISHRSHLLNPELAQAPTRACELPQACPQHRISRYHHRSAPCGEVLGVTASAVREGGMTRPLRGVMTQVYAAVRVKRGALPMDEWTPGVVRKTVQRWDHPAPVRSQTQTRGCLDAESSRVAAHFWNVPDLRRLQSTISGPGEN